MNIARASYSRKYKIASAEVANGLQKYRLCITLYTGYDIYVQNGL